MRLGIEPGIRRARRARSALQPRHDPDGFHSRFWSDFTTASSSEHSGRPCCFQSAWVAACCFRAPSSPRMRIGADRQGSHSGWSVKYGATSQLARCADSALSNVSECPQQRQVYIGMIPSRQRVRFHRYRAVAPFSIIRKRLGASRLPSLRSALRGLDPPGALPRDWQLPERRARCGRRSLVRSRGRRDSISR